MSAAPQSHNITSGETRNVAVDYRGKLDSGELLTGTPVVTCAPTGPTITNKVVNTAVLTINNCNVSIGKAAQFSIGGASAGETYTITLTCDTDATPAQVALQGTLTLVGV